MHKGISTLVAIIFLGLAIISGVVITFYPRFSGFTLSDYPTTVSSGEEFNIKVAAVDQTGQPFTSYTGSVYITSTDPNAILPEPGTKNNPYTYQSSENGAHTFKGLRLIAIDTNETYTITLTDGTKTETSNPITVLPQPTLHHFKFNQIPSPQIAGFTFSIQVEAIDQNGDTLTSYIGTPTLTYSEGPITPNTITSWSNGIGTATVKVTDTGNDCIININDASAYGTSDPFDVNSASSSSFIVDAKQLIHVDEEFTVTVIAIDQTGNIEQDYQGTIHFSSSDEATVMPGDYTFVSSDSGMHMFQVTVATPITITITVTDVMDPSRIDSVTRDIHKQMPTFVGFGLGSSYGFENAEGTLNPGYPLDLQANDLILLHVVGVSCQPATPPGFSLLYGPDTNGQVYQWIYYKFATGSESGDLVVNYPGDCMKMAIMYNFRGVALTDFVEGGGFGSGDSSTIEAQSVTTTGISRLAVSFVFVGVPNDYNILGFAFIGSSGGTWVRPAGEFNTGSSAILIHLTSVMMTAEMEEAGTISGGTIQMIKPGYWGVRAFSLLP